MSNEHLESRSRQGQSHFRERRGCLPGCGCLSGCLIIFLLLAIIGAVLGFFVYRDIRSTTDAVYEDLEGQEQVRAQEVDVSDGEPFSVLLMGIDTGTEGRVEQGRSDTMMVMTVNPNTNQSTIVSIPRDTYTEIVGRGHNDKINHAYAFGGTSMAVNTVQNLLEIPIDYYVAINMEGLEQVVDAVGGITVVPDQSFTQSGYSFTQGQQTRLDGSGALAYSRMRQQDPQGDYGRQRRQREVVQAIISELASVESIFNYRNVLSVMGNNLTTNMSFDDMVTVFSNYHIAANNTNQDQLTGQGTRMNGIYYDIVPEEELNRVQNMLQTELELN